MTTSPPASQRTRTRATDRDRVNLTRTLSPEFAGHTTEELLVEQEFYGYQRLEELDVPSVPASTHAETLTLLNRKLDVIDAELDGRRALADRYHHDLRAPRFPTRPDYERILMLARDLKVEIPLHRFIQDTMPQVLLERRGDQWVGHCPLPLYHDRRPSFTVYPDDHWHCFGGTCGYSGDLFDLVALVEGLNRFSERVQFVAGYYREVTP